MLLASAGNITNGAINVRGGAGAQSGPNDDDGGDDGGGGAVHLLSPNAGSVGGTITVTGGVAGLNRAGGAGSSGRGGGASAGDGGDGADGNGGNAQAGGSGVVIRTTVTDPGSLF